MRRHDKAELREINHCRNEQEFQDQVLQTCIWVKKPLKILISKKGERDDKKYIGMKNKTKEHICKGFFLTKCKNRYARVVFLTRQKISYARVFFFNHKRVRCYNSMLVYFEVSKK